MYHAAGVYAKSNLCVKLSIEVSNFTDLVALGVSSVYIEYSESNCSFKITYSKFKHSARKVLQEFIE
jgi:hypothetical protein